jgi:single-stranded-DNA-specific exonuclease
MTEIKNLKKTGKRILKAIKNKETIILYGDADMDGTASVVILQEAIKNLGGDKTIVYFVDREKQGYGINETALRYLKKYSPALFITLDLGITNFDEVKIAKNMGFEIIVIDHHAIIGNIPDADIVVDPKQKTDKYPFKDLANTGIVYRLAKVLFENNLPANLDTEFLELTGLATLADMMPQEQENQFYIEQGIYSLEYTSRIGLKVFSEISALKNLDINQLSRKIIGALNVSGIKDNKTGAYVLLSCNDFARAKNMAKKLLEKTRERQMKIKHATAEAGDRVLKNSDSGIIFEGDHEWKNVLIGAIASRICNKFKKPSFIYNKKRGMSIGAVRMPYGYDAVKAMDSCAELLISFGGHPPAAGFSIQNKNLKKFQTCLEKYFAELK